MGKIIKINTQSDSQLTRKYLYKGKTYIVYSSFLLADSDTDIKKLRLKDKLEYLILKDLQLTGINTASTIDSTVDVLSAGKEQ